MVFRISKRGSLRARRLPGGCNTKNTASKTTEPCPNITKNVPQRHAHDPLALPPNWRDGWPPPPSARPGGRPRGARTRMDPRFRPAHPVHPHRIWRPGRRLADGLRRCAHPGPGRQRAGPRVRLSSPAAGRHRSFTATPAAAPPPDARPSAAPVLGQCAEPARPAHRCHPSDGGFLLDGMKSFCSGSVGSDRLTVSAWHEPAAAPLIGVLPTRAGRCRRAGRLGRLRPAPDRQRQGALRARGLPRRPGAAGAGPVPTPQATLRSQVAQLIMANLFLGIARRRLRRGARLHREEARPGLPPASSRSVDDPFIQHRYGELWLLLRPAAGAGRRRGRASSTRRSIAAPRSPRDERGEVAIAVAEAKVLAHRAAIEISTQLFELTGARSTSAQLRLRPLLAQCARAHPARPGRLQAARPRPLRARRHAARTHGLLVIVDEPA